MLTVANLYLVKINQGIISPDKNYVKTALIYFDLTLDPPLLLRQIYLVLQILQNPPFERNTNLVHRDTGNRRRHYHVHGKKLSDNCML